MFDHAQIESSLKQLTARSMVIVYQILRHSLLRRARQGGDSYPDRRGERRSAVPNHQALLGSGSLIVIVQSHADGRDGCHFQLEETAGRRLRLCSCFSKRVLSGLAAHGTATVHLDL
jgi:hypothetical protein